MNEYLVASDVEDLQTTAIGDEENTAPRLEENDELLEMNEDFNFDDFQVVRREFFAHLHEPSVTFNNCKFSVNSACLSRFPNYEYAQVLINKSKKILALRPCNESSRDSFLWSKLDSKGKRKPRAITCRLFFAKVMTLMDWNPDYRYKLLGKLIHANDQYLIAFDLTATEVYQKTFKDGQKPKSSRTPVFPIEWQDQFGLPFNEHRQSMKINIFDGYAIYSIHESKPSEEPSSSMASMPVLPESQTGGISNE